MNPSATGIRVMGLRKMESTDNEKNWPNVDEIVNATVIEIAKHGCYISLNDYESKKGFIHISEISTSWVRNIEDFAQIGQVVKAIVIEVDVHKETISCSLKKVPANR